MALKQACHCTNTACKSGGQEVGVVYPAAIGGPINCPNCGNGPETGSAPGLVLDGDPVTETAPHGTSPIAPILTDPPAPDTPDGS